jgi:hypothetical protein
VPDLKKQTQKQNEKRKDSLKFIVKKEETIQNKDLSLPKLKINKLAYQPETENKQISISSPSSDSGHSSEHGFNTDNDVERVKLCGNIFERHSALNQELLEEFFRKEPCDYSKMNKTLNAIKIDYLLNINIFLFAIPRSENL